MYKASYTFLVSRAYALKNIDFIDLIFPSFWENVTNIIMNNSIIYVNIKLFEW